MTTLAQDLARLREVVAGHTDGSPLTAGQLARTLVTHLDVLAVRAAAQENVAPTSNARATR